MTRYAILADVHGRLDRLRTVLKHAKNNGATSIIELGDTGSDGCYEELRRVDAQVVFGNYEVTGWGSLQPENQRLVRALQPMLVGRTFLAAHAAPYLPSDLSNVDEVLEYLVEHGVSWQALFPRLDQDEDARWRVYAELEEKNKRVFFHGHTHAQSAWRVGPSGAMFPIRGAPLTLDTHGRYIVGVGSVGQPEDGAAPKYLIYDEPTMTLYPLSVPR